MPVASIYAPRLKQSNKIKSLPAPVGGLNARDSLAAMPPTQAVILDNWFPVQYGMRVRGGWARWYDGITGTVESLIKYNGSTGAEKLFAAVGGDFIDVTAGGTYDAGDIVASGFANNRWQSVQMANEIATFTVAVNGADTPQKYNGTTWTDCVLTSTDPSFVPTNMISVALIHRRLWFTEVGSTRVWYLPVEEVEGVVNLLDLGGTFPQGGYLQCCLPWSVDTGSGMDDQSVFISSKGDISVWTGFDPDNAPTDFSLVGTYQIGATIGRRCSCKFGSDVAILCEDGVMLLTQVLAQSKMLMQPPLTTMIQHSLSDDIDTFGGTFGWELLPIQRFNQFYINVPDSSGFRQYVQNTITDAWASFSGYLAQCWAKFVEEPFFGADGYVGHAWVGTVDDPDNTGVGTSISATALQAFNYFDSPAQKNWNMCRPVFTASGEPRVSVGFNVDFEIDPTLAPPPVFMGPPLGAYWDVAKWDEDLWTVGSLSWKRWYSLNNLGFSGAILLRTATANETSWISTDFVYLEGNVL